jgi:hypothetical protein
VQVALQTEGVAINAPAEHGHLLGDVPATKLIIVAVLLAVLTPRGVVADKA